MTRAYIYGRSYRPVKRDGAYVSKDIKAEQWPRYHQSILRLRCKSEYSTAKGL